MYITLLSDCSDHFAAVHNVPFTPKGNSKRGIFLVQQHQLIAVTKNIPNHNGLMMEKQSSPTSMPLALVGMDQRGLCRDSVRWLLHVPSKPAWGIPSSRQVGGINNAQPRLCHLGATTSFALIREPHNTPAWAAASQGALCTVDGPMDLGRGQSALCHRHHTSNLRPHQRTEDSSHYSCSKSPLPVP